jgi:competence protein ComGC
VLFEHFTKMKHKIFAFTIIDLVGVLLLLFLFFGLLFPVLQYSRENSRRQSCMSKLKLLGEAIKQYESANHNLPAHKHGPKSNGRISALTDLLPFLNYEHIYREISETGWQVPWRKEKVDARGKPIVDAENKQIPGPYCSLIPEILCPEDRVGFNRLPFTLGCTNFVFSHGDWITGSSEKFSRGVFVPETRRKIDDIVDGTSNTLAASERVIAPLFDNQVYKTGSISAGASEKTTPEIPVQISIKGSVLLGMKEAVSENTNKQDFVPCFNSAVDGKFTNPEILTRVNIEWACRRWADGQHFFTSTNTIFPPNMPNCAAGNNDQSPLLAPPSSYHIDGINALMLDGQVRFISNKINCCDDYTNKKCIKTGTSPFGVWGALGNINDSNNSQ